MNETNVIERAFELARSGACRDINDIRLILKSEGHDLVDSHLSSGVLRQQLKDICVEASAVQRETLAPDQLHLANN